MALVGTLISKGVPTTLDSANDWTPWVNVGDNAGLVVFLLQFDASWNGTLTFQGGVRVSGTMIDDPIAATNLLDGATIASTTAGGTSTKELWRVDASALDGVRIEVTTYAAGSVAVTPNWAEG